MGEKFVTPNLDEFGKAWVGVFSHSPKARLLWRERTGWSVGTYSETRWWSRWEVLKQAMHYFGDIEPFLLENEVSPAYRKRVLAILNDPQKKSRLMAELAVVIDVGEHFVKATYSLEGDGALVFTCFEVLSTVDASIHAGHLPNTSAVIESRATTPGITISSQQWLAYARKCVEPGVNYFKKKFTDELAGTVAAFKAACLFLPHKTDEMKPDASAINELKAFPFLDDIILNGLKQELPSYLAKVADVRPNIDILQWWKNNAQELPTWANAASKVILVQPSSAAAERVFSLLNCSFGPQQDLSLQDYIECSLMLQYNR